MSLIFVATVAVVLKPAKLRCPSLVLRPLRVVQPPRVVMLKRAQATRLAASPVRRLIARAASLLATPQPAIQTQPLQAVLAQQARVAAARLLRADHQTTRLVTLERYAEHTSAYGPSFTQISTA